MSSDISVWVEVRDGDGVFRAVHEDGRAPVPSAHPLQYRWTYRRDYVEFALLGMTSRRPGVEPLVPVRGVPSDGWPPVKAWVENYPMVGASWLMATELQALDWNMRIRHRVARPFDGGFPELTDRPAELDPAVDVDGVIVERPDLLVVLDEGPTITSREDFPFVVDVPLVHVARGLQALMAAAVSLRPARPDTVRVVYAFDQE